MINSTRYTQECACPRASRVNSFAHICVQISPKVTCANVHVLSCHIGKLMFYTEGKLVCFPLFDEQLLSLLSINRAACSHSEFRGARRVGRKASSIRPGAVSAPSWTQLPFLLSSGCNVSPSDWLFRVELNLLFASHSLPSSSPGPMAEFL